MLSIDGLFGVARPHTHNGVVPDPNDDSLGRDAARVLGQTLRSLREQRGLTQKEVAARTGITRNHYGLLEQGLSAADGPANPRLNTLMAVARTLGVPLSTLTAELDHLG
jgi:DNA-binding XRE family transcriptional regulator